MLSSHGTHAVVASAREKGTEGYKVGPTKTTLLQALRGQLCPKKDNSRTSTKFTIFLESPLLEMKIWLLDI